MVETRSSARTIEGDHSVFAPDSERTRAIRRWLDAAIAPEDRGPLTPREVAEADQGLVGAGGEASLLPDAGGEELISEYTEARWGADRAEALVPR